MGLAKALSDKVADTLMLETGIKSSNFIWFGLLRNSCVSNLTAKNVVYFWRVEEQTAFCLKNHFPMKKPYVIVLLEHDS